MRSLWQDIRYGFRVLVRNPGFSVVVVLVLALGIGANTMVFSIVNSVLLRPLPCENPEELVMVWGANPKTGQAKMWVSVPDFADWARNQACFEHLAAYETTDITMRTPESSTSVSAVRVSGDIFSVMGTEMLLGRTFASGAGRQREDTVAIISHRMWQDRMGRDPDVIGRTLFLNDALHTVVGVLPEDFRFFYKGGIWVPDIWVPLSLVPDSQKNSRGNHYLQAIGRLREGVTLSQAQKNMELVAQQLALAYPETNTGKTVRLQSLHEHVLGDARPTLLILSVAMVLVLLVACANVGNLLLARAVQREEEMAIRAALGAGRARVIRQLLVESCLLALLGGACGLLATIWGFKGILALSPWNIPRIQEICVDANVFLFTLAISVVTGVMFGLAPAIRVLRVNLIGVLGAQGRGSTWNVRQHYTRSTLVVVKTALTLVLFVGAGLLIRSFANLHDPNLGYQSKTLSW